MKKTFIDQNTWLPGVLHLSIKDRTWPVNASLVSNTKCLPCLLRLWLNSLNPFSVESHTERPPDHVPYCPSFSIFTWSGCNLGLSSFQSMVNQIENHEHDCHVIYQPGKYCKCDIDMVNLTWLYLIVMEVCTI